ncbi:hypothetical protein SCATT_36380 [Streptantibioticus cattleyicolor NRRL 8057 = DSM 46488]|uniref:Cell wall-binding repeat-containing protein n=1 Tax=Streptantibioticus cattleyicolor (strain ATCC 35852 / DSM 46488 / JCM 4925 / NBRC 14057 / NRRL 8057) TaxID=1003195 RepID=F8JZC9_STREN|nr:hypothetical protein SCATT_36380 [Streptantibioticus cattleyicolor NRRL 8057 = DSM 46488]MYS60541.1 hypothetical protein [Streptomyces sp. SID5468]CCB76342.1 protein of unknown function [Streptantibioticus cattleyicolor NRRL 8057 = DSM 46488]
MLISGANSVYAPLAPALAARKGGPVLLTSKGGLDAPVRAELKRMLPRGRTVYLIGGTDVLSQAVATKAASLGYTVKRLADSSRYGTSVAVAKASTSSPRDVFLATGTDYHSALAAAGAAGAGGETGGVVLLTDDSTMTTSVSAYLARLDPAKVRLIPVGGTAKNALLRAYQAGHMPRWPHRIQYYPVIGSSSADTSVRLARMWWRGPVQPSLASVNSWQDGVTAFSSGGLYGPVVWTDSARLTAVDARYLSDVSASARSVVVYGGTPSVAQNVVTTVGNAIATPGHWAYEPWAGGIAPKAAFALSTAGSAPAAPAVREPGTADGGPGTPVTTTR